MSRPVVHHVCPHGSDVHQATTRRADDRSVCCGAYTSIFTDDGTEYCKCCFAEVRFDPTLPIFPPTSPTVH